MLLTTTTRIVTALTAVALLTAASLVLARTPGQGSRDQLRSGRQPSRAPASVPSDRAITGRRWIGTITIQQTESYKTKENTSTYDFLTASSGAYHVEGKSDFYNFDADPLKGTATAEMHKATTSDNAGGPCQTDHSSDTLNGTYAGPASANLLLHAWTEERYHYSLNIDQILVPVKGVSDSTGDCDKPHHSNLNTEKPFPEFFEPCKGTLVSDDDRYLADTCMSGEARYDDRIVSGSKDFPSPHGWNTHVTWEFQVLLPNLPQ